MKNQAILVLAMATIVALRMMEETVHATQFEIITIPNSLILDNTTHPSLYNGTIAWDDGTYNGNVYYWDGTTTQIVADGSFSGSNLYLYDGKIAYQHNEGMNNGVRAYYWDGSNVTNISGDIWINELSMHNGQIAFNSSHGVDTGIYHYDGLNTSKIDDYGDYTSIHDGQISYVKASALYYWNGIETTLITDAYSIFSRTSLFNGNIAFSGYDGHDNEIYYWDGSTIRQITDNDVDDKDPSLYDGQIAWYAGYEFDNEIFFWDGIDITQVTNNSIPDLYPSLYDGSIAWNSGVGWQGTGVIKYATPEPATILLLGLGAVMLRRKRGRR